MQKNLGYYYLIIAILVFLSFDSIMAAAGDNDTSFGSSGIATSPLNAPGKGAPGQFNLNKILIQPDGKILTAEASIDNTIGSRASIVRYNSNGSIDTAFGSNGSATFPFTSFALTRSAALQSDGKILLTCEYESALTVIRFNSNGSLDTSFDGDGIFSNPIISAANAAEVITQPDGKILVAASIVDNSNLYYIGAIRLNQNGTLDSTFGTGGRAFFGYNPFHSAFSITLQPDGKILVGGEAGNSAQDSSPIILRLNPDGNLDATFNSGAVIFSNTSANLRDIEIQADGKVLLGMEIKALFPSPNFLLVSRLNSNGSPDTTFATNGFYSILATLGIAEFGRMQIQPDGKIVSIGALYTNQEVSWHIFRLNPAGTPDTSFGTNGAASRRFATGNDYGEALALQPDGKIVVGGSDGGGNPIKVKLIRLLGAAQTPRRPTTDFDGDGKSDISIFRPSVGEWYYLSSLTGNSPGAQFGASSDKIAPADFTGDGKTDFAFFRPSDANWYIIRSENQTFFAFPYGANGDIPAPGDFDGDGKADVTIFRPSAGLWASLRSSDGGSTILQFGANGDIPVVADYDGDGKADFSVYRPSAGEWYTRRSSNGSVFGAPFGAVGDKPVQGDYTGDGKADFAIFRTSSGFWYILRSEDQSFFGSPFGNSSDTPTIGDYDGDGKNDFAVFRPSTGNWFVQRSTAGFLAAAFGVATDRPAPAYYLP